MPRGEDDPLLSSSSSTATATEHQLLQHQQIAAQTYCMTLAHKVNKSL